MPPSTPHTSWISINIITQHPPSVCGDQTHDDSTRWALSLRSLGIMTIARNAQWQSSSVLYAICCGREHLCTYKTPDQTEPQINHVNCAHQEYVEATWTTLRSECGFALHIHMMEVDGG